MLLVLSVESLVLFIVPLFSLATIARVSARLRADAGDRSRRKTALTIGVVPLVAFLVVLVVLVSHHLATA